MLFTGNGEPVETVREFCDLDCIFTSSGLYEMEFEQSKAETSNAANVVSSILRAKYVLSSEYALHGKYSPIWDQGMGCRPFG